MSENKNVVEMHGCIVCAKTFSVLAVYTPDDRLVDCVVTSFGGHRVPDEQHPLVGVLHLGRGVDGMSSTKSI
jgi:hypothetical protein